MGFHIVITFLHHNYQNTNTNRFEKSISYSQYATIGIFILFIFVHLQVITVINHLS